MAEPSEYRIARVAKDFPIPGEPSFWSSFSALQVKHFLWLDNGYRPRVDVRLCCSPRSLFVHFDVFEARIRVRYMRFQDPVYKDSCVEMFIDPFPEKGIGYINVEANALGTVLAAVGPDRVHRTPLSAADLSGMEVASSVKSPVSGYHGAEFWTLAYKLPLSLFEKTHGGRIESGRAARANFYKCGDETEVPHYGAWSPVRTPRPDFHRPEFFGRLVFE
ncbi:MAG: hypothetical protein A2Y69_05115 [Candidatus Aminicenantes bacterium RBG_13_59_9]|jgi:hypothetical protein|nr:MAG: hypothetical protein A2Y69_05115 [Candidatus Aminicenantes bacterium RBG_13_59_9]